MKLLIACRVRLFSLTADRAVVIEARVKKLLLTLVTMSAIATSAAYGAVEYFDVRWSGVPNGNAASATAVIGIDTATIPNPGSYSDPSLPSWLDSITLTITGAASGNGTFTLSDFGNVAWDTNGGTLDFKMELVAQPTSGDPWGTTNSGTSGDFNLFGNTVSDPTGTLYFQLTTSGGKGDTMNLTSFAPVPEPGTYALLAAGCAGFLLLRRRAKSI